MPCPDERARECLRHWPTWGRLAAFFHPDNWQRLARNRESFAAMQSPAIGDLPAIYGQERGAATPLDTALVAQNLMGLVRVCGTGTLFSSQEVTTQAGLFAGRYGHTCSLYAMGVYFATYLSDWKGQYSSAYDIRDILQQFPKFMDWWRGVGSDPRKTAPEPKREKYEGLKALGVYLRALALRGFGLAEVARLARRADTDTMRRAADAATDGEAADCYNTDGRFSYAVDEVCRELERARQAEMDGDGADSFPRTP